MTFKLNCLLVGLAALAVGCANEEPPAPRPNVVLVLIDTLRPDHLGFHGYGRESAPFLGELAAAGTVFDNAYSTSCWTAPSTASLFTGLYPPEHGVEIGFFANKRQQKRLAEGEASSMTLRRLPAQRATLPELFQANGYRTLGITTNFNIGSKLGFDRGFDQFEYLAGLGASGNLFMNADGVEDTLKQWEVELTDGQPTLLYLHLNDVHLPRRKRVPFYRAALAGELEDEARYVSEIGFLDQILGRMYKRYGWAQDTIVMVLSDHGEEFLEHGKEGHGRSLYREVNRVLMMISGPGVEAGRRVGVNVSLIDVLPTLADLIGAEPPGQLKGRSLEPLFGERFEPADFVDRTLFASWKNPNYDPEATPGSQSEVRELWSVLHGPYRLIQALGSDSTSLELYDESADPAEQHDLAKQEYERAGELLGRLELFRQHALLRAGESADVSLDQDALDALQVLGYAGEAED